MRELALTETGYLAGLLFLSLVLPMFLSLRGSTNATSNRFALKIVGANQALIALAAAGVLTAAMFAPYAAAVGLASCLGWGAVMVRSNRFALRPWGERRR